METLCRTCCENVAFEDATPVETLIDETSLESLKDALENLLPSVQTDLVWRPVLCNSCFVIVVGFHNFKRDCLKREALLMHYAENRQQGRRIDLFELYPDKLRSVGYISSFSDDDDDDETVKDEVFVVDEFKDDIKDEVVKEEVVESYEAKEEVPLNRSLLSGNRCSYYNCNRSCREDPFLRKFKFPVKREEQCHIWLKNCGNSALLDLDLKELSNRFLCHHHFDKKYFVGRGLALTAVPDRCPVQNVVPENPMSELRAECAECSEQFYTFAQMFRHINVIHNWAKYFKCKLCKKFFLSRLLLKEHLGTQEPQHICKICGKKFLFLRYLDTHTRNHGPFTCGKCGKVFLDKNSWYKHRRQPHTRLQTPNIKQDEKQKPKGNIKTIVEKKEESTTCLCEICGKSFKKISFLNIHKKKHGERLEKCTLCPKKFFFRRELTLHLSRHRGEKKHECKVCHKKFFCRTNMTRHVRVHTGECPYKCAKCGVAYKQHDQLKRHISYNRCFQPWFKNGKRELKKQCEICNNSYAVEYFPYHLRKHTGEKPEKCKICGQGFALPNSLKRHMLIHCGVKPYVCKICGKEFRQQGSIKVHMRRHTGEKPYECKICNKRFVEYSILLRHNKSFAHKMKKDEVDDCDGDK